jgi:hypothetical protein
MAAGYSFDPLVQIAGETYLQERCITTGLAAHGPID